MRSVGSANIGFPILVGLLVAPAGSQAAPECISMQLPVEGIDAAPEKYREFCATYDGACDLEGASSLAWSTQTHLKIGRINTQVNQENTTVSDWDVNGLDDVWDYPSNCQGDCEDFALEKRRLLVENGLPSASLTMAIAFHETQFFPHAVLLVETSAGTWVLDSFDDEMLCWNAVPYIFTHRERPDGQWARFILP